MINKRLAGLGGGALGLLLVTEVADLGPIAVRWWVWRVTLSMVMAMAFLLVPWLQIRLLLGKTSHRSIQLIVLTIYWVIGWRLSGGLKPLKSDSLFTACLLRVGSLGVTLMAIMAGYGAVMAPRQYLRVNKPVNWEDFKALKREQDLFSLALKTTTTTTAHHADLAALQEAKLELDREGEELAWNSQFQTGWRRLLYQVTGLTLTLFCLYRLISVTILMAKLSRPL